MKRFIVAITLAVAVTVAGSAARADVRRVPPGDDYDDSQAHPLQLAAYALHPVGYTLEWLVFRPLHRLVAQPSVAPIFGHRDHSEDASIGTR